MFDKGKSPFASCGRNVLDWSLLTRPIRVERTHLAIQSAGSTLDCPVHNADNLRAVQLLLGHTKLESTVRYLGIQVHDALSISEQLEL
jgi:hypothetical protein